MFDDLKPSVKLEVEGEELSADVTDALVSVECELTRDIASQITVKIANPIEDTLGAGIAGRSFVFLEEKAFQPGNEIRVHLGYGDRLSFVGAGIIQRHLPRFPPAGLPTLAIVARDASVRMMDGETAAEARNYAYFDLDTAVLDVFNRHGITPKEVTPLVNSFRSDLHKKRGMTDYQFVKGLANIAGYEFRVELNTTTNKWEGIWRPPKSDQRKKYTFRYLNGPASTLMSFDPEWGLHDSPTEVRAFYFDRTSRTWEVLSAGGSGTAGESLKKGKGKKSDRVTQPIVDLNKIRIAAGDVAIEYVPERPFRTADEASRFAERWLKARRDNFLTGRGRTTGVEDLRPGDVHDLQGLGVQLSGDWEFTTVRHVFTPSDGYFCDFFANKVLS